MFTPSAIEDNPININYDEILKNQLAHDSDDIESIIEEILKFNVYDFIWRVSSLNLLIENQNKSILFDTFLECLFSQYDRFDSHKDNMGNEKFASIIRKLSTLSISHMIDPSESPFLERVRYYGNYWIFPGINYNPAYCLQGFLDVLCLENHEFDSEFTRKVHLLIRFILQISDRAANIMGYDLNTIEHVEVQDIRFPNVDEMKKLKKCVCIDYSLIEELLPDQSLISCLFYDVKIAKNKQEININKQDFFAHPFVRVSEHETILLNPAILTSFLVHQIILLADQYNVKTKLIDAYNNRIWSHCKMYLKKLGHYKIREDKYGIKLINNECRKEAIFTVGNAKLLFLHFICDSGQNYTENSMFEECIVDDQLPTMAERAQYFCKNLSGQCVENIYQIVILNSFGRILMYEKSSCQRKKVLSLSPFELFCISINEREHNNFIASYIDAKSKIPDMIPASMCSELNSIEIYTGNDYSFYISDEFDAKTLNIFFGLGESLDYIIRAIKTEDRHLIDSYDGQLLQEVALLDSVRHIYYSETRPSKGIELVIKFKQINIWITTPQPKNMKEYNVYYSLADMLSYWIAECHHYIDKMQFTTDTLQIDILLTAPINDYYLMTEESISQSQEIQLQLKENAITMNWTPAVFHMLSNKFNTAEKEIVVSLLEHIGKFNWSPISLQKVDEIFQNPIKKKIFAANISDSPLLKPTNRPIPLISSEDTNQLLDEIGEYFLSMPEYSIGKVPDEKRANLANQVVGYLYSLLKTEMSTLSSEGVYEYVYFDLESVMYEAMISQARYAYDVSCYPEKEKEILEKQNHINESSVALKFLIEFIAATPPSGSKAFDTMQYGRILAICSLIVNWAYRNDLFRYHIFNTPIEFLKSGRIGMKQAENEFLMQINSAARTRKLEELSDPNIETFFPSEIIQDMKGQIDDAFWEEYGFTFGEFTQCIESLEAYGNKLHSEVKRCPMADVVQFIVNSQNFSEDVVKKVIAQISLTQRHDFLTPPKPFKKEDVYPWRFNRELSFTRRPVIQYGEDLIWGNRQLHHMWRYTIDLIISGKYKARKPKLLTLIGKLSHKRGNDFNSAVAEKLRTIDGIIVDERVSKINGKKIAGTDKNVLGDIDVLYIVPKKRKIVVAEVKDFSFAKNPYEMEQEYQKIFVDGDKQCYLSKHKRRATWIKEHVDDVIEQYHLTPGKWSVRTAMFVSEEIISNSFYHKNEKIIVYSEISPKKVKSV